MWTSGTSWNPSTSLCWSEVREMQIVYTVQFTLLVEDVCVNRLNQSFVAFVAVAAVTFNQYDTCLFDLFFFFKLGMLKKQPSSSETQCVFYWVFSIVQHRKFDSQKHRILLFVLFFFFKHSHRSRFRTFLTWDGGEKKPRSQKPPSKVDLPQTLRAAHTRMYKSNILSLCCVLFR